MIENKKQKKIQYVKRLFLFHLMEVSIDPYKTCQLNSPFFKTQKR